MKLLDCRVDEVRWLGPDLAFFVVRPDTEVTARPGQFAMLSPPHGEPLLARPMSLAGDGELLSFLIRASGRGTQQLTAMRPGDVLSVVAPLGQGFASPKAAKVILLAGGCGLAPMLFAARDLERRGIETTFLYGGKTETELVLVDEIRAVCSTVDLATDDGSIGRRGFVTDLLDATALSGDVEVWTCGPEPMMAQAARACAGARVDCFVAMEARMACGRGLCLGCSVLDLEGEPRYVCVEGPVFHGSVFFGGAPCCGRARV